jgi:hypothetical protein
MKYLSAVLLLAFSFSANAAIVQYDFSYGLDSGYTISGSFLGELQADNDTISMSELLNINYDGPLSGSNYGGLDYISVNIASLSGANLDFTTTLPLGVDAIIRFQGGGVQVWQVYDDPISLEGWNAEGIDGGAFNAASWSIQAVPVPAAVWLFGSALAAIGFLRRRPAI